MTKFIDLLLVEPIDNDEKFSVFISKDEIDDLVIAQDIDNKVEVWFMVSKKISSPAFKNGYTMYILSKHNK